MKIMITGGMGFIGSHLVDALVTKKHKIIVLTKSYSKKSNLDTVNNKIKIEKIDVTDFKKVYICIKKYKPDIIIHLAGQTSHLQSFKDPLNDLKSNTMSTLFILETIKKLKLKCRFLLGSTFIVTGRPLKLPVDEQTSCNPGTIYGANRLTSEYYCKIYHDVYALDSLVFRITNSYGPREQYVPTKNAINYLIYKAHKGEEITLFNKGKTIRDLIYVSDVVSAIMAIARKGRSGELYWVSSYEKTSLSNLGKLLNQITGVKIRYAESPKYTKKVDVGNFVVNNKKLKSLGWKPKVTLQEGIRKTINYFESLNL